MWYSPLSYTYAQGGLEFNLSNYGVYGVNVTTTQELAVQVVCTPTCVKGGKATLNVTVQGGKPDTTLTEPMFYVLVYNQTFSAWIKTKPTSFVNYQNGTYQIGIPQSSPGFLVGVRDSRGILVIASSFTKMVYTLNWQLSNSLLSSLAAVPLMLQLLTNGTVQLLGQNLISSTNLQPIPPIPVKDIRVNETVSGKSHQVPFQVEDWGFDYTNPLGLTSPDTLFSNFQMIVTLVNTSVSAVTIYWNGADNTSQSSYSIPKSFTNTNNCGNYCVEQINNGLITINIVDNGGFCGFSEPDTLVLQVYSSSGSLLSDVSFEDINGNSWEVDCKFGMVVLPGVVREIAFGGFVYGEFGETTTAFNVFPTVTFLIPKSAPYITTLMMTRFTAINQQRDVTSYTLTVLESNISGSVFVQNSTSPSSNTYGSDGSYYIDAQPNTTHLWSAICSSSRDPSVQDPCNPNEPNLGVLMMYDQESALYSFADLGDSSQAEWAGIGVSSTPSPTLAIDPYIQNSYGPLSFDKSYTLTWIGVLWFWPGTQTLGNTQYNVDAYMMAFVFETPPSIALTLS
ncbi:MAG: hypothetical protein QW688_07720 [Thermoprotei archaeon]